MGRGPLQESFWACADVPCMLLLTDASREQLRCSSKADNESFFETRRTRFCWDISFDRRAWERVLLHSPAIS